MKRFLAKFIIIITIIAGLTALGYLQFYYRGLDLITQPFAFSKGFSSDANCDYSILDASIKMTSWDSTEANLVIHIFNNGTSPANKSYDVNITLVKDDNSTYMVATDTDTALWTSGEITTLVFPIDTADLGYGQFSLYFRIWDDSSKQIVSLDNRLNCEKNGYFIGSLAIKHGIFEF